MANVDALVAAVFLGIAIVGCVLYFWRVHAYGQVAFDRIASVGDGAVMRQGLFEMGYWWMQPIARALVAVGFTANGVTWFSLAMWIVCGALAGGGRLGFAVVAGTFAAFADTLDGLVARLRMTSSEAGEIFDGTVDRYGDILVYGGIAVYYNGIIALQILTLAALAGAMAVSHASAKSEALHITISKGFMRRPERCVTLLVGLGFAAFSIPTLETNLHFSRPIGLPLVLGLSLIAIIANFSAITRLRELAAAVTNQQ